MDDLDVALNEVLAGLDEADNQQELADPDEDQPEPDAEPDPDEVDAELAELDEIEQETDPESDVEDTDADEEDDDRPVFEIEDENGVLVLPDGTEVPVKDGALRHADYTRKTQELADRRKQFEAEQAEFEQAREQTEQLQEELTSWLEEQTADPAGFAEQILRDSGDPTGTLALAIKRLADANELDPKFVEMFGLGDGSNPVQQKAEQGEKDERLTRVERELEERREAEQARLDRQQKVQELFDRWDQLKLEQNLSFDSGQAESESRRETLEFAIRNGIEDLSVAHDALQARKSRSTSNTSSPSKSKAPSPAPDDKKKRATRAMQVRSSSSSRKPKTQASSLDEAAENALDAFLAGAS